MVLSVSRQMRPEDVSAVRRLGHISRAQILAGLEFQFILFMLSRGPSEVRVLFGMGFGLIGQGKETADKRV